VYARLPPRGGSFGQFAGKLRSKSGFRFSGWPDMNDHETTVSAMKEFVQEFVAERDWQQFHDPKNLSMSIAIEAAELMEHFQWLRSDQLQDLKGDSGAMAQVEEELADVFCYVLAFAGEMGIDLCASLDSKMVKNRKKYPVERFKGRF